MEKIRGEEKTEEEWQKWRTKARRKAEEIGELKRQSNVPWAGILGRIKRKNELSVDIYLTVIADWRQTITNTTSCSCCLALPALKDPTPSFSSGQMCSLGTDLACSSSKGDLGWR